MGFWRRRWSTGWGRACLVYFVLAEAAALYVAGSAAVLVEFPQGLLWGLFCGGCLAALGFVALHAAEPD